MVLSHNEQWVMKEDLEVASFSTFSWLLCPLGHCNGFVFILIFFISDYSAIKFSAPFLLYNIYIYIYIFLLFVIPCRFKVKYGPIQQSDHEK